MGWLSDLSHKFQDWRDDMKGTFVFDAAKSIGRVGAKGVQYGAAPAGAFFFGPLGALVGTGLGTAAGQVGPNKNREAQAKRDLISGGAVTAATSFLSLITGGGLSSSLQASFSSLFGWGPQPPAQTATPGKPMNDADLWAHFTKVDRIPKAPAAGGQGGFNPLGFLSSMFGGQGVNGPQANTAQLQQQYKDQLELARKYQQAGDLAAAGQAAALAEAYRQQLIAQGQTPGAGGGFPILPLLLIGGVAWFLLRKK